jgi:CubicO group peptidase (beta-lactamase class C family)
MRPAWTQPGVEIVENGRILHAAAVGVRSVATAAPVDENTLCGTASGSNNLASATVARPVADGRLGWHDPVTRHRPWFRLRRDRDTNEVTLRDLLAMRTGIGSSKFTFRRASGRSPRRGRRACGPRLRSRPMRVRAPTRALSATAA